MVLNILSKEMSYDDWWDKFKPITNHLDNNAGLDGCMFETYGKELEHVRKHHNTQIWTYMDSDEGDIPILSRGYHLVNRIGYLITENTWTEEDPYIILVD